MDTGGYHRICTNPNIILNNDILFMVTMLFNRNP